MLSQEQFDEILDRSHSLARFHEPHFTRMVVGWIVLGYLNSVIAFSLFLALVGTTAIHVFISFFTEDPQQHAASAIPDPQQAIVPALPLIWILIRLLSKSTNQNRDFGSKPISYYVKNSAWFLTFLAFAVACFLRIFTAKYWLSVAVISSIAGIFLILRSMWDKPDTTWGVELKRKEFPRIWEVVDDTCKQLNLKKPHQIWLEGSFRCFAIPYRYWRFPFPVRRLLCVGLPLLEQSSPNEFRAILAHRLTFRQHRWRTLRFWTGQVDVAATVVMDYLSRSGKQLWKPLRDVMIWPLEFLNVFNYAIAWERQYWADIAATNLSSWDDHVNSIVRLGTLDLWSDEEFFPRLWRLAATQDFPPPDFLEKEHQELDSITPEHVRRWLALATTQTSNGYDSFPNFMRRMEYLDLSLPGEQSVAWNNFISRILQKREQSAATHYLGEKIEPLRKTVDEYWAKENTAWFSKRHVELRECSNRLEELQGKAEGTLNLDEQWQVCENLLALGREPEAEHLLRNLLKREPQHASANQALGNLLLKRDDEEGISHLEALIKTDPASGHDAYESIAKFWAARGDRVRATDMRRLGGDLQREVELGEEERKRLLPTHNFIPLGVADDALRKRILEKLKNFPEVKRAYLVEREVKHLREKRYILLAIEKHMGWLETEEPGKSELQRHLLQSAADLDSQIYVLVFRPMHRTLRKRIRSLQGTEIYISKKKEPLSR